MARFHTVMPPTTQVGGRGAQTGRQLKLMRLLVASGEWATIAELCDEIYGKGYRTAYRDIEQLVALGIPIERRRSPVNEIGNLHEYRLRKSALMAWFTEKT